MICPKCGRDIPDDAVLCCYCGRRFVVDRTRKKRGNGEGNAYKRGNTWTVRISSGSVTDENGKMHRKRPTKGGFKTRADALAYAETLKKGPFSVPDISMENLFKKWEEQYQKRVCDSTMTGYRTAFKHFSDIAYRPISSIRPAELQAQIDACKQGKRTKQVMKVVAGLLWKFAMDNDLAEKNAAANLYTGNDATSSHEPFNDLEMKKIRKAVETEPYADYVLVLCYTGFRPGEMLELKKDAVDLKKGYIVGGGKTEAGTNRIVTIPPAIREIIQRQIDNESEYLFPNKKTGTKMSHGYFRNSCFFPLMEKLDITGKVPYSCRHTYSNLIKNAPGDTGDKARLMGHTDYTFTQERYQSSSLKDLKKITNALK